MDEHRFVIALTFEQLNMRRARHLRAMVMWEQALLEPSRECPPRRFRGAQDALPHPAGDRAANTARIPERFGIVKVWRPRYPSASATVQNVMAGALR